MLNNEVRIEVGDNTLHIISPNTKIAPKFLTLTNPDRLVIDMPSVGVDKDHVYPFADHPILKTVRVGKHVSYVRIVLDLKAPLPKPPTIKTGPDSHGALGSDIVVAFSPSPSPLQSPLVPANSAVIESAQFVAEATPEIQKYELPPAIAITPTVTPSPTAIATDTNKFPPPSVTALYTATDTATQAPPQTASATPGEENTETPTANPTVSDTVMPTATLTPTLTDTAMSTATLTSTPTDTATGTPTDVPIPTQTATSTYHPLSIPTPAPTETSPPEKIEKHPIPNVPQKSAVTLPTVLQDNDYQVDLKFSLSDIEEIYRFEDSPIKDLKVKNRSISPLFITATVYEITNPGQSDELKKPTNLLLASPKRFQIEKNEERGVRLVLTKRPNIEKESIFRIEFIPDAAPFEKQEDGKNKEKPDAPEASLNVATGISMLVVAEPIDPSPNLEWDWEEAGIRFKNKGNTNVLLDAGKGCKALKCVGIPSYRVYADSTWELPARDFDTIEFLQRVNSSVKKIVVKRE